VASAGAAEMNRLKGHNYLTVFADLMAMVLLFGTPRKDSWVWSVFNEELLRQNGYPRPIWHMASEIRTAYTKGVSGNLGNARVAYDTFHVIHNVLEACG